MLNVLDLFSGIGGFSLGLERTGGFKTVAFCEIEPFCRRVLAKHWPDVPIYEDIESLPRIGGIDAVFAGFPCKQTSRAAAVHGRRDGLQGTDSRLWYAVPPVLQRERPLWVCIENPDGARKWEDQIAGGLEDAGYRVRRLDLSAWDIGAPHLRRRCFWLAHPDIARLARAWEAGSSAARSLSRRAVARNAWLSAIPGIGRVADGVPARVDRRKRIDALGNAVVPQITEFIGRAILAANP